MPPLTLVVAATLANGIGQSGRLLWHLSHDMAYFARVTTSASQGSMNAIVMGRNTWESIPTKHRPLKGRMNVIVSKNANYLKENSLSRAGQATASQDPRIVSVSSSLQDAIVSLTNPAELAIPLNRIFIIGGASIYKAALDLIESSSNEATQLLVVDRILMTRIFSPAFEDCDVFFPEFRNMKARDGTPLWIQSTHKDLEAWVGDEVPRGKQKEKDIEYEFQMWIRKA